MIKMLEDWPGYGVSDSGEVWSFRGAVASEAQVKSSDYGVSGCCFTTGREDNLASGS